MQESVRVKRANQGNFDVIALDRSEPCHYHPRSRRQRCLCLAVRELSNSVEDNFAVLIYRKCDADQPAVETPLKEGIEAGS